MNINNTVDEFVQQLFSASGNIPMWLTTGNSPVVVVTYGFVDDRSAPIALVSFDLNTFNVIADKIRERILL